MTPQIKPVRDLSGPELATYVADLARRRSAWEDLVRHDPRARCYEQIYRDSHLDVWLICWSEEQDTGFHDHDMSSGAVAVITGAVCEERLALGASPVIRTYGAPSTFHFDASVIHRVQHAGTSPAVTLHAYSPPLERLGAYRTGPDGELVRETIPSDEELRPAENAGPPMRVVDQERAAA